MIEGIIEAVVQVGAQETRYLRCGRGAGVVVVLADEADDRLRLMRRYASEHCVIAPVPHPAAGRGPAPAGAEPEEPGAREGEADAVEQWLRGVIDGLGLDLPAVLLAPEYAWLAERLVAGYSELREVVRQDG